MQAAKPRDTHQAQERVQVQREVVCRNCRSLVAAFSDTGRGAVHRPLEEGRGCTSVAASFDSDADRGPATGVYTGARASVPEATPCLCAQKLDTRCSGPG